MGAVDDKARKDVVVLAKAVKTLVGKIEMLSALVQESDEILKTVIERTDDLEKRLKKQSGQNEITALLGG